MEKICVIGQGYIGIPTAMVLVEQGFTVLGVDKDDYKINKLKNKELPFHEQEFTDFSKKIFETGRYSVSKEPEPADVFIICVPTPITDDKKCDFTYVISAAESIYPVLKKGNLVILESTVPPFTCEEILIPILEKSGLKALDDFYVSHAPERLLPGNILHEIIYNDRIIGGVNEKSTELTYELYKTFCKGEILLSNARTAEMCKLMENTYRDVNIALANEFSLICSKLKIDPYEAIKIANHHPRVNILNPGPGVGGHCIPIDPWFIVEKVPDLSKLIYQARLINDGMPKHVTSQILDMVKEIKNPTISILGVAYKPNVDDPRESPVTKIIEMLENEDCNIKIHDPLVKRYKYPLVSLNECLKDSDIIAYLVNHDAFKEIDPEKIKDLVRNKNIYIAGNFSDPNLWIKSGFLTRFLGQS